MTIKLIFFSFTISRPLLGVLWRRIQKPYSKIKAALMISHTENIAPVLYGRTTLG